MVGTSMKEQLARQGVNFEANEELWALREMNNSLFDQCKTYPEIFYVPGDVTYSDI